ncbi:glycosyltransferase family 39 protein [bacterium]|nr:glycosyltransferase family 39 protein [bacterium]
MNFNKHLYPIALIIITFLGLILRLLYLDKLGTYWFDEMASLVIARQDFPKIWEYLVIENNPPLSFLFLHFWIELFGEKENVVRISSLIFGVAAIPVTYYIGKELFSRKTGIIAGLFMSLSFFQIFYSTDARMYPLFQFLALASIYFFWKILNKNAKRNWFFYLLSTILLVYTHIFAWTIISFQILFLYIYNADYQKIKNKILTAKLFILLFFLTWFISKIQAMDFSNLTNGLYFRTSSNILSIGQMLIDLFYENAPNRFIELPLVLLIISLGISAFLLSVKDNKNNEYFFIFKTSKSLLFMTLWITIPLIIIFLFFPSSPAKYIIFVGPALYLLIAQGIVNLKLKPEILIPTILFISIVIFSDTFDVLKNTKQAYIWDKVVEYVSEEEKPQDQIIIHSFIGIFEFRQYYKGTIPYEGFYIFDNNEEINKMIIKRNWNTIILEKDYPKVDKKMQALTNGHNRIFLIEVNKPPFDPYNLVDEWFIKNNWHLTKSEDFKKYKPTTRNYVPKIWLWEKSN